MEMANVAVLATLLLEVILVLYYVRRYRIETKKEGLMLFPIISALMISLPMSSMMVYIVILSLLGGGDVVITTMTYGVAEVVGDIIALLLWFVFVVWAFVSLRKVSKTIKPGGG